MPVIQDTVLLPKVDSKRGLYDLKEAMVMLNGAHQNNGQAWSDALIATAEDRIHVSVATPCRDSLAAAYNSERVDAELERFLEHAVSRPEWTARGKADIRRCTKADWTGCQSFYVFTHALDETSPVCAGDDGTPAPLYLLEIDQQLREELVFWMSAYKNHDLVWLDSRDLEKPAHEQMADLDTELARRGRDLAARIEGALDAPTYYYLQRYYALEEGESVRPCPGCGEAWAQQADRSSRGMAGFDFVCERCRLVSHVGVSLD